MKYNLIFFVILSVSLVYGGVSFRKPRSPQWQPTYNGTAAGYQPRRGGSYYRHPVPPYNRTRITTTRAPPPPYVNLLPSNRYPPIVNVTGRYQPTYNQTRPTILLRQPHQPPLGRHWNNTIMTTNSRLYPNLSERFGGAAAPQPAHPYNPYFPTNYGPSNPNFNTTRTNLPTFYPTGRYNSTGQPPNTYTPGQQPFPGFAPRMDQPGPSANYDPDHRGINSWNQPPNSFGNVNTRMDSFGSGANYDPNHHGLSSWNQPLNSNTYASGQQPFYGYNPNSGLNTSAPAYYNPRNFS